MIWSHRAILASALRSARSRSAFRSPRAGRRDPSRPTPASTRSQRAALRCPDFTMSKPFDLALDRKALRGQRRAARRQLGQQRRRGPAELFGTRTSQYRMRARQRIYSARAGRIGIATGARLYFKYVPGQGRYWKCDDAARVRALAPSTRPASAPARPGRAEGRLLPARPRAHPSVHAALAAQARVPGVQPQRPHEAGSRSAPRSAGPTSIPPLPRAVDRRDRPARLLRLRAHRRPRATASTSPTSTTTRRITRAPAVQERRQRCPGPERSAADPDTPVTALLVSASPCM